MISLDHNDFTKLINKPGFFTHLFDVKVDGTAHRVLPRDVQFDPVTDIPLHVDFLRVVADTRITVHVPVSFTNHDKSPGLKRGGTLNIVRHKLELVCDASNIPAHVVVDLEGYDLGASIHFHSIKLPAGVTTTIAERDFTVATIATPSGVKSDAAEGGATEAAKT